MYVAYSDQCLNSVKEYKNETAVVVHFVRKILVVNCICMETKACRVLETGEVALSWIQQGGGVIVSFNTDGIPEV
jgi:hypothetical protein